MITLYHGTPNAGKILINGIDINHPRNSDPGDFGWGVYASGNLSRAKVYGDVFAVTIDESDYAYLENPYFLEGLKTVPPKTFEEKLFYSLAFDARTNEMLTIVGTPRRRERIAKFIRLSFLEHNYKGIITPHNGIEAVVFDPATILKIELL